MNTLRFKLIAVGVLFAASILSGIAVTRAGRPLNPGFFNVHKLIAVAMVVMSVLAVVQYFKAGSGVTGFETGLLFVTGACFLALLVTGGFLSFEITLPRIVIVLHRIAPVLSLVSSVGLLMLALRRVA